MKIKLQKSNSSHVSVELSSKCFACANRFDFYLRAVTIQFSLLCRFFDVQFNHLKTYFEHLILQRMQRKGNVFYRTFKVEDKFYSLLIIIPTNVRKSKIKKYKYCRIVHKSQQVYISGVFVNFNIWNNIARKYTRAV